MKRLVKIMNEPPPPGLPIWNFRCPSCKRGGHMAWENRFTKKPVPPENFICPDCGVKVEILGRFDQ